MSYVSMTDTFMSGWGQAEGKTNQYVVECDTQAQEDQIVRAGKNRPEMKRVKVVANAPRSNAQRLVTLKHFSDLGGVWTDEH